MLSSLTVHSEEFPTYSVKSLSYDCPAAAKEENYTTSSLEPLKLLALGKDEWIIRTVTDLRTDYGPTPYGADQLNRLVKALGEKGTKMMIVYIPPRGLMHADKIPDYLRSGFNDSLALTNYQNALKLFAQQGAFVADYSKLITPENSKHFFFKRDIHWTPDGAQATAKLTADYIKQLDIYKSFEKKNFINKPEGVYNPSNSGIPNAWRIICGQLFPKEYAQKYTHEVVNEGGDGINESNLFSEQSEPEIVVVGTSFSANTNTSFVGFLREYLHADISNEAIGGGGFNGSMTQYLASENFHKSPPKLLIWEVMSYYALDNEEFYREVIPMVNSGCDGKKVVLSDEVQLQAGKNEFLFNSGSPGSETVDSILNKDHIIDLQFSDPNFKNLELTLWQLNGRKDPLKIKRAQRVNTNGRFMYELKFEREWGDLTYLSTELNIPEEFKNMNLKVRLCHK
ncbi:MAG TPA: alginate biosynthesis protein AlgX [Cellvibrio sp.]|nr:alginate biosynthesis protein AlgX [Cellvibrio sp.]